MARRKLQNWIGSYLKYTEGTESPPLFHMWVALGTLAGAMQRKIYMDADYYKVHSNMYIILVSPPGRSRKSTALRIGKSILKGVLDYGQEINFSTQASSVAALVKQLSVIQNKEHQSLTSFSSELGSLLGSKSIEMVDFLVDIFDCEPDWDKQTVSRGLEKIENPWFNLLAATTPQWMGDNLSKTAVEGGFVGRSLFIYSDVRLRVAFPKLTEEQRKIRVGLIHDLAHISQLKGEVRFSPEAHDYYENWYNESDGDISPDPRLVAYYDRKHLYVQKLSMILRMAQDDSLIVQQSDVETALDLLTEVEPGMHKAFSSVGKNIFSVDQERIKEQIARSPKGLTYKQILAMNIHAVDKDRIDQLLDTLTSMGEIQLDRPGGPYVSAK